MPEATPILSDYLTREQLAEELGLTVRSLERWAWLRTGPRITRVGRRVYYSREDVRRWLESQKEAAA